MIKNMVTIRCLSGDGDKISFITRREQVYIVPRALTEVVIGKKAIDKIIRFLKKAKENIK